MAARFGEAPSQQLAEVARQLSIAPPSSSKTPKRFPAHTNVRKVLYRHTPAPSNSTPGPREAESSPLASQESFFTAQNSGTLPSSPLHRRIQIRRAERPGNSLAQTSSPAVASVDEEDEDSVVDESGTYSEKRQRDDFAPESEPNADGLTYCLDLPEHWPEYLRFAPTNDPTPREITKVWDVFAKHIKHHKNREWYLLKMWGTWVRVEYAVQWLEMDNAHLVAIREFPHGVKILIDWELAWSKDIDHHVVQTWRSKDKPRLFIEDPGKGCTTRNEERLTAMGLKKLIAQAYDLPSPTFDDFFNGDSDHGADPDSDKDGASINLDEGGVWKKNTFQAACDGIHASTRSKRARGKKRALAPKQTDEGDDFNEVFASPELEHILPTTERPIDEGSEEDRAPSPPRSSNSPGEKSDGYVDSDDEPLPLRKNRSINQRRRQVRGTSENTTQQAYEELKSPERKRSKNLAGERSDKSRSASASGTPVSVESLPTRPRQAKETPVPLPANYAARFTPTGSSRTPPGRASSTQSSPSVAVAKHITINAPVDVLSVKEELFQNASSTWGGATENRKGKMPVRITQNARTISDPVIISSATLNSANETFPREAKDMALSGATMAQRTYVVPTRPAGASNDFRTMPYHRSSTEAGPSRIDRRMISNSSSSTAQTPFAQFDAKKAAYVKSMLPTPTSVQPPVSKAISTSGSSSTAGPSSAAYPPKRRSHIYQDPPRAPRATRPEGSGSYTTHQESIRALHAKVPRNQPARSKLAKAKEALAALSWSQQEQLIRDVRSASRDGGGLGGRMDEHGGGEDEMGGGEGNEGVWGDDEEGDPFASPDGMDGDTDMRFD